MLFVVAAATTVSLHGCGTSTKDLQNQAKQIMKDFPGIHEIEGRLLAMIFLKAKTATASERRHLSKTLSAMYKKDMTEKPLTDGEWEKAKEMMKRGPPLAPEKVLKIIDRIDQDFEHMTSGQKSRLRVFIRHTRLPDALKF